MKTIQITKREQHVLMTVVRTIHDALKGRVPSGIDRQRAIGAMSSQPGINACSNKGEADPNYSVECAVPTLDELDSVLERLSSNDEE